MANETSKSTPHRQAYGDFDKYLHGVGIDVGCGADALTVENGSVDVWDLSNGDAMLLDGLQDNKYDFAYSSHCLEHLKDIDTAIMNWTRIIKPNGFLYFTVPDYDLYEKGKWPSTFAGCPNYGHKHSFSINFQKEHVQRTNHFNIQRDLVPILTKNGITTLELRLELGGYNFLLPASVDQTTTNALIQICVIGQKK